MYICLAQADNESRNLSYYLTDWPAVTYLENYPADERKLP